jgi:hypothetical protein
VLSVGFSTCSTKDASGVSALQHFATFDCSERGTPFTTAGFARIAERAAVGAGLASAYASPLRLRARQQTSRHPGDPMTARSSLDHEHGGPDDYYCWREFGIFVRDRHL